jgi:hypothetical protein
MWAGGKRGWREGLRRHGERGKWGWGRTNYGAEFEAAENDYRV